MAFYGRDLAHIHDAGFGDLARAASTELLGRVEPPGLVIDLGCGSGITAQALLEAGFTVLGIDAYEEMLRLARVRAPAARFVRGLAHEVELERAKAITAIGEVLGYGAHELAPVFGRVHEALLPGGLLLFDLAGPGRGPAQPERSWRSGDGWVVCVEAEEDRGTATLSVGSAPSVSRTGPGAEATSSTAYPSTRRPTCSTRCAPRASRRSPSSAMARSGSLLG